MIVKSWARFEDDAMSVSVGGRGRRLATSTRIQQEGASNSNEEDLCQLIRKEDDADVSELIYKR